LLAWQIALASFQPAAVQGTWGPPPGPRERQVRGSCCPPNGTPGMGPDPWLLWAAHFKPAGPHPPEPAVSGAGPQQAQNGRRSIVVIGPAAPPQQSLCCCTSAKPRRADSALEGRTMDSKDLPGAYGRGVQGRPKPSKSLASIRFWGGTAASRQGAPSSLKQALDRRCQPPFNKEKRANAGRRPSPARPRLNPSRAAVEPGLRSRPQDCAPPHEFRLHRPFSRSELGR